MDANGDDSVSVLGDPLVRPRPVARSGPPPLEIDSLYREHRRQLLNLAAAITLDRSVAEEVVHEAFAGLQRRAAEIDEPVRYLHRSVVNQAISVIRRRRTAAAHPMSPERDGVLAWVAAPMAMSDELLSIAEGIRTLDGPATIPHLLVTGLGSPWDASDNNADGVVYARIGDALCVGIGWVPDPCSRVVTSEQGSDALQIAGLVRFRRRLPGSSSTTAARSTSS